VVEGQEAVKVFVPVFVVAIIAIAVLLLVRNMNRTADLRRNLSNTSLELVQYKNTVRKIEAEVRTQAVAGYFDLQPFQSIINEHEKEVTT
jgi:hypothetical protein